MFKPAVNKRKWEPGSPDVFSWMAMDIDKWNSERKTPKGDYPKSQMYYTAKPTQESKFDFTDPQVLPEYVLQNTCSYKFSEESENISPHKDELDKSKPKDAELDYDFRKAFDDLLQISKDDRKVYDKFELSEFIHDSKYLNRLNQELLAEIDQSPSHY